MAGSDNPGLQLDPLSPRPTPAAPGRAACGPGAAGALPAAVPAAVPSRIEAASLTRPRRQRTFLWAALVVLLLIAQTLLMTLAYSYRAARLQESVEVTAAAVSTDLTELLARDLQAALSLPGGAAPLEQWRARAEELLIARPELLRLERRDAVHTVIAAVDTRSRPPLFSMLSRHDAHIDTELACTAAQRRGGPTYSDSFYVPQTDGMGLEVMDLCIAEPHRPGDPARSASFVVATYSLTGLLDELTAQATAAQAGSRSGSDAAAATGHDLSFVEADGARLAHSRSHIGAGVYRASRMIDLPGTAMQLHVDSAARRPSLMPDMITALVIGLSLTLLGVVALLARDVRKRAGAEAALAEALAFRKAMEDSVVTGLRARDLQGRTTYVNPAFCAMVGFELADLIDRVNHGAPPYWPAELAADYQRRQQRRFESTLTEQSREAVETVFVRRNGERFPAMVFEAPLLDSAGRHTGWMSAVLDLSVQRRVEEVARQQQERLAATARLATVGEMASLLSHELNQPLSAIAAYATGSLNMMDAQGPGGAGAGRGSPPDPDLWPLLRQASQRIAEQAERAGRVIRSVHDFVRRREHAREAVGVDAVLDAVLPLITLQARKSDTRIEFDIGVPAPRVLCDRAMVEQVLLNLSRNAVQAMDGMAPARARVLTLRVRQSGPQWVRISVGDAGPGVADEVARQLFTPFFTTRSDGMGLGLSVCRSIAEQHGGALTFSNLRDADGAVCGAEFEFTLPAAPLLAPGPPPAPPALPARPAPPAAP